MVIDYKNYSKGYRLRHTERRWGRLLFPLFALALLYGGFYLWAGRQLSKGRAAVQQGQLDEAWRRFERVRKVRIVRTGQAEDGLGIVALHRGDLAAARDHLLRAGRGSAFSPEAVIASFTSQGKYGPGAQYGEYALGWDDSATVRLEYAIALAGMQRLADAEKMIADVSVEGAAKARRDALVKVIAAEKREGGFAWISDHASMPLAKGPLGAERAAAEIAGGLRLGGALGADDFHNHTLLAIDRPLQEAAAGSLGYPGALVVVQPSTGEILAAVSNPPPGDAAVNFAFETPFEPGSIIKLITLSAALRANLDLASLFPFRCTGVLDCEGQPFYDWTVHGDVKDIDEAVAESCNIAFARMGQMLGREVLQQELERYGFGRAPVAGEPPMAFGGIKSIPAGSIHTARLSVGLEHVTITALHGALMAAALSRDGAVMTPRLLREKRTILQEPYYRTQPTQLFSADLDGQAREVMRRVMTFSVTSDLGTGRRAAVEGLPIALKTGTSGDRELGLDSVIIGFAPADAPRIAFCLYAHGAGKAELEGARILREFLTHTLGRLKDEG